MLGVGSRCHRERVHQHTFKARYNVRIHNSFSKYNHQIFVLTQIPATFPWHRVNITFQTQPCLVPQSHTHEFEQLPVGRGIPQGSEGKL